MRRPLLWSFAATFFIWEHVAIALWLRESGSLSLALSHAWDTMRQDWFVLLLLTDAAVFAICVLVWLWRDLGRSDASRRTRWLWFGGTLIFGCPGLLGYLAERRAR